MRIFDEFTYSRHCIYRRRAERGQTLVIALAVLFFLLVIGGLFVARVARNLVAAGRSRDTGSAQQLAQAGLDYCNNALNSSPQGADWRPVPSPPINNADPDYYWLQKGFNRLPLPGGRALIHISYDPNPDDPNGQAILIESVGRPGSLPNPPGSDPTVFVPNGRSPVLRRELIAYKQIGITDFGLYITGQNRNINPNYLGTPSIGPYPATVLGNPMLGEGAYASDINGGAALYGFPIYCNGDLTFGGDTYLYEGHRGGDPNLEQESVLVNGNINLSSNHAAQYYPTLNTVGALTIGDGPTQPNYLGASAYLNEPVSRNPKFLNGANGGTILPSNINALNASLQYNTFTGIVRDGAGGSDVNGYTRSVPRLSPPQLDTVVQGGTTLRYRALTRDSGDWVTFNGKTFNTGYYGLGTGIYVNNTSDLQKETGVSGITGGYSLRSNWTDPGDIHSYWNGPFYQPPGVHIQLLGNMVKLTRDDGQSFINPNGSEAGSSITIPLSDYARKAEGLPALPHDGDDPTSVTGLTAPYHPFQDANSYGVNLVIYTEGNAIVSGVYGAVTNVADTTESSTVSKLGRVHLTVVSAGTVYIDGNLIRGDGYVQAGQTTYEHASTCALMAKDYVCVNTTQFMRPLTDNAWSQYSPDIPGLSETSLGQTALIYDTAFSWAFDPANYTTKGSASPVFLMLRQTAAGPGPAFLNLFLDPSQNAAPAYQFPPYLAMPNSLDTALLGLTNTPPYTTDPSSLEPRFQSLGLNLGAATALDGETNQSGYDNLLRFQYDQNAQQRAGLNLGTPTDYQLSAAMVTPQDIRVEAAIYAQNKSFFVIPGFAFNPDASDSRAAYLSRNNVRVSYNGQDIADHSLSNPPAQQIAKDMFPFYNEPPDVRITLFGSVAENYTASQGDQAEWMRRWGYIPQFYGATQYYLKPSAPVQVPDLHLTDQDPLSLMPGLDTTQDYRTQLENQSISTDGVPITNGFRMEYNPAFAMPYYNPTNVVLIPSHDPSGALDSALLRKQDALRRNVIQVYDPSNPTIVLYTIVQTLPPIPDMPVCPNFLYAGDSAAGIGSQPTDTDNIANL